MGDESAWDEADEPEDDTLRRHREFAARNAAVLRGGNRLHATSTATSIRRDPRGEPVVTDGAFAETKEALGGYYLIDVADLDEAIAVAKQVPARFGGVEVRPVSALDR